MQYLCEYRSPVGVIDIASDGDGITGLWLRGQKYHGQTLAKNAVSKNISLLGEAAAWLDRYFRGENPAPALPLAPAGSEFRQLIWKILCDIPYGEVTTYKAIGQKVAAALGRASMSAQAVGGAVGHNPISILIPCHRVVGTDGGLTGYAGGVDKKEWLLTLEGAIGGGVGL